MAKAASRGRSRRKSPARKSSAGGTGGMLLWCVVGALAFGGIVAHDNWNKIKPVLMASSAKAISRPAEPPKDVAVVRAAVALPAAKATSLPIPPAPILIAAVPASKPSTTPASGAAETIAIKFGFCGQGAHKNCVDDGRTFFHEGGSIVLAGIDTPSAERPKCDSEKRLGIAAKIRLLSLLNAGPFTVRATGAEKTVLRDGHSLGSQLVTEGLARPATAMPANWCA